MNILVTGGAGFIGSALVRRLLRQSEHCIINVDKLTYAGHLSTLEDCLNHPRHQFHQLDIVDRDAMTALLKEVQPHRIINLAAESHVDRSIRAAGDFIQTNLVGTFQLLEAARDYWTHIHCPRDGSFLFHQVSTDEVFGALGEDGQFSEDSRYDPRSPYSASKAGADHLVRAWHHTYGLPALVTHCSNNYGPFQYPEKLIPLMLGHALEGKALPVYGKGCNVRDWLYVDDHAAALQQVAERGQAGATYAIGGNCERRNIEVVTQICDLLEQLEAPKPAGVSRFQDLIQFVEDRPGHDYRYAIDASRIRQELGWQPQESFASGLEKTLRWYLQNTDWCRQVVADARQRLDDSAAAQL